MFVMASEDEVVEAFAAIEKAWEHYRATLRACLAEGTAEGISGRQAEISRRLDRTREMLRRDAMTDGQREALRIAEAERKRTTKELPPGVHKVTDGVTTTNPRGRTWYVITVDAPDHAVTAALAGAGLHGATVIPAGPRTQLRVPGRATAIRMYDALVVRGYRIVDEEPEQ